MTGPSGNPRTDKVWEVNGQMYCGVAGTSRYADILQYASVPEAHKLEFEHPDFNVREYLVTQVVPAWQEALKESYGVDPDTAEDWRKGAILLTMKGRIFTFDSLLSVCEFWDRAGIGSGADYALGALSAGKSVRKALEIAANLDPYTGGELVVWKGLK